MDSGVAKQFLISRVVSEAEHEGITLSDVEKKMLQFTEVQPSLPDMYEVNAEFEQSYDPAEYEAKITRLLKSARDRDVAESPVLAQQWTDALASLHGEDHYILVMVARAFGHSTTDRKGSRVRDFLIYIAVAIAMVVLILINALWKARK